MFTLVSWIDLSLIRQTKWPITLSFFNEGPLLETLDLLHIQCPVASSLRWTECPVASSLRRTECPVASSLRRTECPVASSLRRTECPVVSSLRRTECPVVSSLRRAILRIGRTISRFDRYFKACELRSI